MRFPYKHIHSFKLFCRTTNYCLNVASEQEKTVTEKWLPELNNAVLNAHKFLEDCKYVGGLVSTNLIYNGLGLVSC